ncbi:SH3 domain-containing protein [Arvimicrobium flavum]|uniref:SH3 domain-containing protein n=1 Tax=Arvimicrobium flavum TaxID=3393320 RepID=UPI00237A70CF|nr:SH3 domain-containing protein [Mesorhizobium shangrilense]
MTDLIKLGMVLALASGAALHAGATNAATFAAWEVANVAWGDTLNVRKYPSSGSQKQAAYPNGTVLQMTGKCTGGVNLLDIAHLSEAKQRQAVRYQWCEVWHDPKQDGDHVTGWVYGRYIAPY